MKQLIEEFISHYNEERQHYESVKERVAKTVESRLKDSGILAITSSRLKDSDRLREKLHARDREKQYLSLKDIKDDIVDLVGIRIALYFPNDAKKVGRIIHDTFNVKKVKCFPSEQRKNNIYTRRFEGYCATHYRVHLKGSIDDDTLTKQIIEIQVASLLMHAWSEVEHDLSYKQKKGEVSYDEYESLDELNGLVIAGEVSLQRLQRISEMRIESENKMFSSHYELATFIYDKVENENDFPFSMGDVETLYRVFEQYDRLTPKKVSNDLKKIDLVDDLPIAQQLIDLYANKNAQTAQFIINKNADKKLSEITIDEKAVGSFMVKWIFLENSVLDYLKNHGYVISRTSSQNTIEMLKTSQAFDDNELNDYLSLKKVRNNLVHGIEMPNSVYLADCESRIDSLTKKIKSNP